MNVFTLTRLSFQCNPDPPIVFGEVTKAQVPYPSRSVTNLA